MIKYIAAILIFLTTQTAYADDTKYTKIISEWSSQIVKQRHNITEKYKNNFEFIKKRHYFKIIKQWKFDIKKNKWNKNFNTPFKGKKCH